jgi:hypothetical protein
MVENEKKGTKEGKRKKKITLYVRPAQVPGARTP